jgi:hypothetical protein
MEINSSKFERKLVPAKLSLHAVRFQLAQIV